MRNCVIISVLALVGWVGAAQPALGAGATRDLSQYTGPGVSFVVSIAIDPPPLAYAAGMEEAPPAGWSVSAISNSGQWDAQSGKVKWGPFFDPSIPSEVTYEATPPSGAVGVLCFAGTVSFDGLDESVNGQACIAAGVPTLSQWGLTVMLLLVLTAGTIVLRSGLPSPAPGAVG